MNGRVVAYYFLRLLKYLRRHPEAWDVFVREFWAEMPPTSQTGVFGSMEPHEEHVKAAKELAKIETLMRGRKDPRAFERHLERVVRWGVKPRKTIGKYAEGV